jgi:lysyl-tRNA synthetase class 2
MPERFLDDLEQLEAAAGIALGLDRLVMLLCGARTIDEVVSFPPEAL